ncbi:GbpC/Spa domain-containing protein [Streptococcus intermedius]
MKEYGSIRKLKAYGACGVLLGMSALMLSTANVGLADEVVSAPKQEVASAAQSNNVVDHSVVDKAVAKAQAAGIKTIQDPTVDKGTVTTPAEATKVKHEIAKDYEAQAAAIDKTTEDYAQKKAAYEKAVAETKKNNEQIAAENQAKKEAHEKAVQASKETNQAVEEAKAKIKKQFPDAKVTETTKEIPVDPTKSAYDRYTKVAEQVQAENKKATETYQAEKTKEDKEIAETKAYNEAVRKQNAANKAKVDAENAEITKRNQAQLANKQSIEAENEVIKKRNEVGQAKVDAENKEIDKFNKEVAEFNKSEDERAARERAKAEADKHKDGYLSEVVTQGLVFKNEENAHIAVTGADSYISAKGLHEAFKDITKRMGLSENQLQQYVTYFSLPYADDLKLSNAPDRLSKTFELYTSKGGNVFGGAGNKYGAVNSKIGKTVTVTYSNLQHSTFKGKPISRMELDITVKADSENILDDVVFGFSQNPAKGIEVAARYKDKSKDYKLNISLKPRFYDADGKQIVFEDTKNNPNEAKGILSISSLNAYKNHVETARPSDTARFIPISGSSIVQHANGLVYSNEKDNSNGNHFGLNQHNIIDSTTSPYYWYLAGALALKGANPEYEITVTSWDKLGDRKGEGRFTPSIWFTVTSDVVAAGVPTAPRHKETKPYKTFTPERLQEVPMLKLEELKKFTPEKEKEVPTPKAKLSLVTVNSVPDPKLKPKEKEPTSPEIPTIHYHHVQLKVKYKTDKTVPKTPAPALPQTGEHSSTGLMALGLSLLAGFSLVGLKKQKEN